MQRVIPLRFEAATLSRMAGPPIIVPEPSIEALDERVEPGEDGVGVSLVPLSLTIMQERPRSSAILPSSRTTRVPDTGAGPMDASRWTPTPSRTRSGRWPWTRKNALFEGHEVGAENWAAPRLEPDQGARALTLPELVKLRRIGAARRLPIAGRGP